MTLHSLLAGVLLFGAAPSSILLASQAAQTRGNPAGQVSNSACTLGGGGILDGPGGATFERVADGARVVVEAYVQFVDLEAPPTRGGPIPQNDVLLIPVRVLKGPQTLGQFAVGQIRASGFFEMQPGQHFILFLNDLDPRGSQLLPERPGFASSWHATHARSAGGRSILHRNPGKEK